MPLRLRLDRDLRPLRRRQKHAAPPARRTRQKPSGGRARKIVARRPHLTETAIGRLVQPGRRRTALVTQQPSLFPHLERRSQCRLRPPPPRPRHPRHPRRRNARDWSTQPTSSTAARRISPAARRSASLSPAPSRPAPACCCSTSHSPPSTAQPATPCWTPANLAARQQRADRPGHPRRHRRLLHRRRSCSAARRPPCRPGTRCESSPPNAIGCWTGSVAHKTDPAPKPILDAGALPSARQTPPSPAPSPAESPNRSSTAAAILLRQRQNLRRPSRRRDSSAPACAATKSPPPPARTPSEIPPARSAMPPESSPAHVLAGTAAAPAGNSRRALRCRNLLDQLLAHHWVLEEAARAAAIRIALHQQHSLALANPPHRRRPPRPGSAQLPLARFLRPPACRSA